MKTKKLFFLWAICLLTCVGCDNSNSIALRNIRIRQEIDILGVFEEETERHDIYRFENYFVHEAVHNQDYLKDEKETDWQESISKIREVRRGLSETYKSIENCHEILHSNIKSYHDDDLPLFLETVPVQQKLIESGKIAQLENKIRAYEALLGKLFGKNEAAKNSIFKQSPSLASKYFKGANVITAMQGLAQIKADIMVMSSACISAYIAQKSLKSTRVFEPCIIVEKDKVKEGEEYIASVGIASWKKIYPSLTIDGKEVPLNEQGIGEFRIKPTTVGKHRLKGRISSMAKHTVAKMNIRHSKEMQTITQDFDIEFEVLPNK